MKRFFTIFITFLIVVSKSAFYETLQKQYKQLKTKSISGIIPSMILEENSIEKASTNILTIFGIQQTDLQIERKEYDKNYIEYIKSLGHLSTQLQKWRPDPELSTSFDLFQSRKNETFILKGRQFSRLWIDVNVTNADPLYKKKDGVIIILINLSALNEDLEKLPSEKKNHQQYLKTILRNIQFKKHVRSNHFIVIPFTSDIYEILIIRQSMSNEKLKNVHVQLEMNIEQQSSDYQVQSQKIALSLEQEQQMVLNMKNIVQQNEITFLDSLQLWQKVQQHRKQHQTSFEWNEAVELYECLGLFLLYVVEYVVLRYITRKKVVI